MSVKTLSLQINTKGDADILDITSEVAQAVSRQD